MWPRKLRPRPAGRRIGGARATWMLPESQRATQLFSPAAGDFGRGATFARFRSLRWPRGPFRAFPHSTFSPVKKVVRTGLLAAFLVSGAAAANAQILFGPVAGAATSTARLDFKNGNAEPKTSMVFGPTAGWLIHIPFGKFAVQPSLMYSRKGFELEYDLPSTDSTLGLKANISNQLGYITLPANLVFTTGGDHGFQIFAGGYAAIGVGGKRKVTARAAGSPFGFSIDTMFTYTRDVSFSERARNTQDIELHSQDDEIGYTRGGLKEETGFFRTVDYGIQAGIGYLVKGFQVQASAQAGGRNVFTNDIDDKEPVNVARNLTYQLTVAYLFGR